MSSGRGPGMISVYAVVEARSEQRLAEQVLAAYLGARNIFFQAARVGKPGHKGGNRWEVARKDILNFLKMSRPQRLVHVTTMFDYYGMPFDWPGRAQAESLALPNRASAIEQAIANDIIAAMGTGFNPSHFIPYVQMHEFEALIFADPAKLHAEFPERTEEIWDLISSVKGIDPEEINDDAATAPSKRIIAQIPEYEKRKPTASANVLKLIGIDTLRTKCGHFADWLEQIEALKILN
jgi:hypothetical protein